MISKVNATLLDSNNQCSTKKKSQNIQRNRKLWPIQRKNINRICPEKDLMADVLKTKTMVFRVLKELKEDMEQGKKTMCEQN